MVDLRLQYESMKCDIDRAIRDTIEETAFIGGRRVAEFEAAFAKSHNVRNCIGVANGTDALYIVLKSLNVGAGDEVITVANSWISTSEAISQTGARPVFVDVDEYFNIDVDKVPAAITNRTKAILPVHLYGQPACLDRIQKICTEYGLLLVEDCAQAHLAHFDGKTVGTFGSAGTFSFFPGKNLGAYGDAGAIVTNDDDLADRCRMFANHGAAVKHEHVMEGVNSRLDGLQAAILLAKLRHLEKWTANRQEVARLYDLKLSEFGDLELPAVAAKRSHVFHLYVVKSACREALRNHLTACGISTGIHYPTPLPLMKAYEHLRHTSDQFPIAAKNQSKILSLPIYPELGKDQIDHIASAIGDFFQGSQTT